MKSKDIIESENPSMEIMQAATNISKKNKKAVIGATQIQELPKIMNDKSVMNLVKTDPKNAGKLGQMLTGLDAKEIEKNIGKTK